MGSKKSDNPHFGDGASPGKIFIGGLAKDTTLDQFTKYFGKYGEITDSVIMKDRHTGRPRGFGFITYADPSVVDTVIAETHVINDKQVEIKRTIPKGSAESKDFKTKKIFVGGIPTSVTEDEFKNFFSKYGKVVEHEIIRDHVTKRSRGFGFVVFDNEQVVDTILANGNMIDMEGSQVEIKKAEPKKPSNPAPAPAYGSESRGRGYGDGFGGFGNSYSGFGSGGFGPASYRTLGGLGGRLGDYGGYGGGGSEFAGRYSDFGGSDYMGYRGEASLGYSSRFGSYAGGFSGGYGGSGLGSYGPTFVNSILVNFGLSEEMHNPVSVFVLLGIVLAGAALGYWIVRKFVISEDGSVDVGIAQFVKWAMRVIAAAFIFQSTLDTPLAMGALVSCLAIYLFITLFKWNGPKTMIPYKNSRYSGNGSPWQSGGWATAKKNHAEFLSMSGKVGPRGTLWNSPRSPSAWSDSPVKGLISSPTDRVTRNQQDYYSTFHKTPTRRKMSKKEWETFTKESTREAVAELASSPEFTDWMIKHADRIQLLPDDTSDETLGSGSDSTDENAVESCNEFGLFKWQHQKL